MKKLWPWIVGVLVVAGFAWFAFYPTSASAHANSVNGVASCQDGQQKIVWTITNDFNLTETAYYSHTNPATTGDPSVAIAAGNGQTGTVNELYAGDATTTETLYVKGVWSDAFTMNAHGSLSLQGNCLPPPVDVCENLEGNQAVVPEGYDENDGVCTPHDFCPNDEGVQSSTEDCTPPTDVCPNIEGDQATVPEGDEVNQDGQCVPIDVCSNIEGDQASVPEGLVADGDECVPESSGGGGSHHNSSGGSVHYCDVGETTFCQPRPTDTVVAGSPPVTSIPLNALPATGYGWEEWLRDEKGSLMISAFVALIASIGFVAVLPRKRS